MRVLLLVAALTVAFLVGVAVAKQPEARELRDEILRKLRALESDMLRYVEITGPPRIRDTIQNQGAGVSRP